MRISAELRPAGAEFPGNATGLIRRCPGRRYPGAGPLLLACLSGYVAQMCISHAPRTVASRDGHIGLGYLAGKHNKNRRPRR